MIGPGTPPPLRVRFHACRECDRVLDEHEEFCPSHPSAIVDTLLGGAHEHAASSERTTHQDEHGTRTVYTCACGASRSCDRLPRGSWLFSEWSHPEAVRAG